LTTPNNKTQHTPISRYAPWHGPTLFRQGFRPFFLGCAGYAIIALALWIGVVTTGVAVPGLELSVSWHAHEMIFGVAVAAVAGFLLTAIPNWTGRMPLQGWGLIALSALWLVGRAAMALESVLGAPAAAVFDMAFLVTLFAVVVREIIAGQNWRNAPIVAALGTLTGANALSHMDAFGIAIDPAFGHRLGIAVLCFLITLIGGRIIPSFTGNWLAKQDKTVRRPSPMGYFDHVVILVTGVTLLAWSIAPARSEAALLLSLSGVLHLIRVARWRGIHTIREPLVWSLHVGYLWLPVGFILIAADAYNGGAFAGAGVHALTTGAIAGMIVAVITRATLGHTGQALSADRMTAAIYSLIFLAAVARTGASIFSAAYGPLLSVSAIAWCIGFAIFCLHYGRILLCR